MLAKRIIPVSYTHLTVELSIHIHQEYRGRGVASKLMAHILDLSLIHI